MMRNAGRWIDQSEDLHLAGFVEGLQVREQKGMVAGLDANDVMHPTSRRSRRWGALALRASSTT